MRSDESDIAFFHRSNTHNLIDDLSELDDITIYVGAGASVERTGLSWGGLIAQLLSPDLGDYKRRTRLADALSPSHASSAAVEYYKQRYPTSVRERIMEALRSLIYQGDDEWTFGHFNERVATYVDQLFATGVSVCVVTTNYDDFLLRDLREVSAPINEITIGRAVTDEGAEKIECRIDDLRVGIRSRDSVTVLHLHGILTNKGQAETSDGIYPVITEDDYLSSEYHSAQALEAMFEDRNVLILGASVTDPPLVRALLATRPSQESSSGAKRKRYAFQAIQGIRPLDGESLVDPPLLSLHELRLAHLGVIGVYPDFYIQIPQILEEVRHVLTLRETGFEEKYASPTAIHRYGMRLVDWWYQWMLQDDNLKLRQAEDTAILEKAIENVRKALDAPAAEPLKIEVWLRWHPENSRKLALWATSTGTLSDYKLMRTDDIGLQSQYISVRTFATGSPMFAEEDGRWRSFLAKPLWFQHTGESGEDADDEEDYSIEMAGGSIPVGVVCVASMWNQERSSISPQRRQRTVVTLGLLDELGKQIINTRDDEDVLGATKSAEVTGLAVEVSPDDEPPSRPTS